ncbi:hypothetical protein PF005_g7399 [Phytophthora fragariae]|uniref:Uncharacterized protein n=1 Tax=Phytophthora fragariae TaxID=53985 RepID=A0A6A3ZXI0_9STRA|nr:hypothetical protein PF005_g7399 [Phytophthora fragariae]KAE9243412.1 hypothetical protein PF002_g8274 [Phytophthora fragariae]
MVAPTGKTPRHTLTPTEKQKCLEALRRERCARRAGKKEERARVAAAGAKEAAAEAKEAAAEAKETAAEAKETAAEAKETAAEAKETAAEAKTAAKEVKAVVAEEINTQEEERAPPAEAKTTGKTMKSGQVERKHLRRRRPCGGGSLRQPPPPHTLPLLLQRFRRLQMSHQRWRVSGNDGITEASSQNSPMREWRRRRGAAVCTGLNSDEDPDVREEPEDEEDADEDSWDGDWDIGSLTDEESDAELEELPESVYSSAAKDSKYITARRETGWEYGK